MSLFVIWAGEFDERGIRLKFATLAEAEAALGRMQSIVPDEHYRHGNAYVCELKPSTPETIDDFFEVLLDLFPPKRRSRRFDQLHQRDRDDRPTTWR